VLCSRQYYIGLLFYQEPQRSHNVFTGAALVELLESSGILEDRHRHLHDSNEKVRFVVMSPKYVMHSLYPLG